VLRVRKSVATSPKAEARRISIRLETQQQAWKWPA